MISAHLTRLTFSFCFFFFSFVFSPPITVFYPIPFISARIPTYIRTNIPSKYSLKKFYKNSSDNP
ncbi:hypothetical protein L873DRAFT_1806219 [Choiromyces venosus 120613-1]|uniref:Uncharacterized protein n=1 Tax=Choiromyces venosus 120613-1 TaxID=1336337 RepID=A0A3N4JSC4_9PEZI|nr:hypothetical protein L873DRAFT_1806219 [Choiromyces venosus 120613-1]